MSYWLLGMITKIHHGISPYTKPLYNFTLPILTAVGIYLLKQLTRLQLYLESRGWFKNEDFKTLYYYDINKNAKSSTVEDGYVAFNDKGIVGRYITYKTGGFTREMIKLNKDRLVLSANLEDSSDSSSRDISELINQYVICNQKIPTKFIRDENDEVLIKEGHTIKVINSLVETVETSFGDEELKLENDL